jgi:hypothetical protein
MLVGGLCKAAPLAVSLSLRAESALESPRSDGAPALPTAALAYSTYVLRAGSVIENAHVEQAPAL